ncbi:MAG: potassium transporter TrkH [Clostridia bacterium]|nr:potassium transporter TrkH [Clostridia bacterium]
MKKRDLSSAQIIPIGFLLLIAVGTVLLSLPFATASGTRAPLLTALFTSTTSVCVTGLVVVDTFSYWSVFGKIVILALIQVGGLGIVAVSSMLFMLLKRSFTIRDRAMLRDSFDLDSLHGVLPFLRKVILGVLLIEGIGALLYAFAFIPKYGFPRGIWYSVFHSISAFCNAGLDLIGPDSFLPFHDSAYILTVTMLLIVLGGLGYIVWFDAFTTAKESVRRRFGLRWFFRHLGEHTKLVLLASAALIVSGAVFTLLLEMHNPETLGTMPWGKKILNATFQSVTYRTAGFSAIPQGALSDGSVLLGCVWMFIGGSPMGTAGGIKTVTLAVLLLSALSYVRGRADTVVFRRSIPYDLVKKAAAILFFSLFLSLLSSVLLVAVDGVPMTDAVYEVFSATGTVGLSRGVTPHLSVFGRILIILCMYLGRIGPISLALFFHTDLSGGQNIRYAQGRYYVG